MSRLPSGLGARAARSPSEGKPRRAAPERHKPRLRAAPWTSRRRRQVRKRQADHGEEQIKSHQVGGDEDPEAADQRHQPPDDEASAIRFVTQQGGGIGAGRGPQQCGSSKQHPAGAIDLERQTEQRRGRTRTSSSDACSAAATAGNGANARRGNMRPRSRGDTHAASIASGSAKVATIRDSRVHHGRRPGKHGTARYQPGRKPTNGARAGNSSRSHRVCLRAADLQQCRGLQRHETEQHRAQRQCQRHALAAARHRRVRL